MVHGVSGVAGVGRVQLFFIFIEIERGRIERRRGGGGGNVTPLRRAFSFVRLFGFIKPFFASLGLVSACIAIDRISIEIFICSLLAVTTNYDETSGTTRDTRVRDVDMVSSC